MILDRTVFSFRRPDEEPFSHIVDGTAEAIDSAEWADAKSSDTYRNFVRLLNQTLSEMHHRELRRHPKRHYLYFRPTEDLSERRLSTGKSKTGRVVFRAYPDEGDPANARHFRHHALDHQFVRLDGHWFLELNPTYHFTTDGYRDLPWGAELVKGMKRREKNNAVRALVDVWARYLRGSDDLFSNQDDAPIRFGELETFDVDRGVDERAWRRPSVASAGRVERRRDPLRGVVRATVFDEPEVEFAAGCRHVDPRFGVADYGPVDLGTPGAPREIRIGIVGPADGIDGARRWLERCREPIARQVWRQEPATVPRLPGIRQRRHVPVATRLRRCTHAHDFEQGPFEGGVEARRVGCCRCRRPVRRGGCGLGVHEPLRRRSVRSSRRPRGPRDDAGAEEEALEGPSVEVDARKVDFRDLLKAKLLSNAPPLQLIRSSTWDPSRAKVQKSGRRRGSPRQMQDEATRAWNLHTALYYKAGGVPWRLVRSSTDLSTLFVGVSFFHTPERDLVHTSVAQVFNERGDGVVVRGGPAARRKDDRQPHLSEADAQALLGDALAVYRREHHNFPARVALHKTSEFDDAEVRGFEAAADDYGIEHLDLVWVQSSERMRLFRNGDHAVLRGTFVRLEERRAVLFTRGTIDFYRLYPGMYVPVPLGLASRSR